MDKTKSTAKKVAAKPAVVKKELEKPETEKKVMANAIAEKKGPVKPFVEKKVAGSSGKKA